MSWLPRRGTSAGPRLIVLRHHRLYEAEARPLYRLGVSAAAFERLVLLLRAAPEVQERRLKDLSDAWRAPGEPACELAGWEELAALAPRGMEVGAHTLTHPFLSRVSPARQDAEIGGSVELI